MKEKYIAQAFEALRQMSREEFLAKLDAIKLEAKRARESGEFNLFNSLYYCQDPKGYEAFCHAEACKQEEGRCSINGNTPHSKCGEAGSLPASGICNHYTLDGVWDAQDCPKCKTCKILA